MSLPITSTRIRADTKCSPRSTDRIADAYREQEARIAGIVEDAVDAASATVETVTDAVADATGDAAEAAKDATKKLTD